jgi:Amt family ammonium transporter
MASRFAFMATARFWPPAGAFLLFVGWIGFNGGSTLEASPAIAGIIANTVIAAATGTAAGHI